MNILSNSFKKIKNIFVGVDNSEISESSNDTSLESIILEETNLIINLTSLNDNYIESDYLMNYASDYTFKKDYPNITRCIFYMPSFHSSQEMKIPKLSKRQRKVLEKCWDNNIPITYRLWMTNGISIMHPCRSPY